MVVEVLCFWCLGTLIYLDVLLYYKALYSHMKAPRYFDIPGCSPVDDSIHRNGYTVAGQDLDSNNRPLPKVYG